MPFRILKVFLSTEVGFYRQNNALSKSSEAHKDLILRSAGEGIYGMDKNGLTTFINPAALTMLGYREDELIGKAILPIIHPHKADYTADPTQEPPIYSSLKEGKAYRISNEKLKRKDGSTFPVEYTSTPIRYNGQLCGAVVIFSDISLAKQQAATIQLDNLLMDRLVRIQDDYINGKDPQALYNDILNTLINLTQSSYGFIGNFQNHNDPTLVILAITNTQWKKTKATRCQRDLPKEATIKELDSNIQKTLRRASLTINGCCLYIM